MGGVRRQPTNRPKLTRRSIRQRLSLQRAAVAERASAEQAAAVEVDDVTESEWIDDSTEADNLPGGWKQSYPSS